MNHRTRRQLPSRSWQRPTLALFALACACLPVVKSCSAPFDPPGKVDSVRILSVDVSPPYAQAGETVSFKMTVVDALGQEGGTPLQITWLGGCFDPEGDQYFNCYAPLGELLAQIQSGGPVPSELVAQGPGLDTFELRLPDDIITRRPRPAAGAYTGIAYVFFAACRGEVRPVPSEGTSLAGSFPLGCFDESGKRLGPDSFVAGYTQVYAFEDQRINNPPVVESLDLDGDPMSEDFAAIPTTQVCDLSSEQRAQSGCAAQDEFAECTAYELEVRVPKDVGEFDPDGVEPDGTRLRETVWVSYFSDGGTFDSDTKLVSDAKKGFTDTQGVQWVPPELPGVYRIWAVVRDSRGGSTTLTRFVNVR